MKAIQIRGTVVARRKKPKFDEASSALEALAVTPRVKPKSALEIMVERDFDKLLRILNEQQYSLSEISVTLNKYGIGCTPKLLKSALYNQAIETNRVSELPEKLIPDLQPIELQTLQPEPAQPEDPSFEALLEQGSQEPRSNNGQTGKKSRFNTVELKFN